MKHILTSDSLFWTFYFTVVCLIGGAIIHADEKYCVTDICPPGAEHVACGRDIVCFKFKRREKTTITFSSIICIVLLLNDLH